MGHIFDLSKHLSREDFLSVDSHTQNKFIINELNLINQEILHIIEGEIKHNNTDYFYKLSIRLEQFVKRYVRELKFLHRLRIELLELLYKIYQFNVHQYNLSAELVLSMAHILQKHMGHDLPDEMIHDLMVYETFEYLGLTAELGVQGKLNIAKVRDVDTYSFLMTKYKKPKIAPEYLEQYFALHRNELLVQLVSNVKHIRHVHYDFDYLQQLISIKLILGLQGQDLNTRLNQRVRELCCSNK